MVIAAIGVLTATSLLAAGLWSLTTLPTTAISSGVLTTTPPKQELAPVSGSDSEPENPGALPTRSESVEAAEQIDEPTPLQKSAASQCAYGRWGKRPDDKQQANAVMKGRAELSGYGTLTIPPNPDWRPQASLDNAGNGHIYSLWWALPLLRVGLAENNQAMVDRFYQIVTDFILDDPISRPEVAALVGQIESGSRMFSLTCALAGPAPNPELIIGALANEATRATRGFQVVNNTSFHQAAGVFAVGCALHAKAIKRQGLNLMSRVTKAMVRPDGSVNEGSVIYARNTHIWTEQEIARIKACGRRVPAALRRADNIPTFLAYSIRPDGYYDPIGDGETGKARWRDAPKGSVLQYATTAGRRGDRPSRLFAQFDAGFIFGRSTWAGGQTFRNASYYSMRTGPGPSAQYHAHSDEGSVNFSSRGAALLLDAGAYSYSGSAASFFVRSRLAHNVINLPGLTSASPSPEIIRAQSSAAGDLISIVDRSYPSNPIHRSVWYDRRGDFLIVMDGAAGPGRRSFQNWNLGVDRAVRVSGASAATEGKGANLSVISVGNAPTYSVAKGQTSPWRGWNSPSYGEITPAPSLHIEQTAPGARYVTVLIPRSAGVAAKTTSAVGSLVTGGAQVTVSRGSTKYNVLLRPDRVVVGAAAAPNASHR